MTRCRRSKSASEETALFGLDADGGAKVIEGREARPVNGGAICFTSSLRRWMFS